jgi:UDP-glucose 4-epimerase
VFVSSGGVVYGEPDVRPTPEHAPKLPRSPYGVTKLTAEQYLYYYRAVHGLECAALRYANVYGPRQDPHGEAGVVAIFCNRLRDGAPITVFGDGEQTRDYVYVGDCAAANLLVGSLAYSEILNGGPGPAPAPGPNGGRGIISGTGPGPGPGTGFLNGLDACAFNVGTGVETSVNELATRMMTVSGRTVPVQHADARAGELMHSCIAPARLEGLGWTRGVSLDEGLDRTYRHITGETR